MTLIHKQTKRAAYFVGGVLAILLLFAVVSWPLPRFAGQGIPSSAQNIETPAWRYSIPGDHLQLLYHFDLMRDMLSGRIPLFHNVYEFNIGNDGDRYRAGAYFFPMSAFYTVWAGLLGQAGAWNMSLLLSVLLSGLFMWGWLRRFTRDPVALALGVLVALLLPFRWISLFGGSPAGMALLWVPLVAWGVDVAVREARPWAGAWVGAALLCCFWSDLQVFYFTVWGVPVFALISLASSGLGTWRQWWKVVFAGIPFFVLMVAYHLWRKSELTGSLMGEGRSWGEVRLFSPARWAFLQWGRGVDDTVFIGWIAVATLVMGGLYLLWAAYRNLPGARRRFGIFACVAVVCLITLLLALGASGPRGAWCLRQARDLIPYYEMIRQPFKIYALMPMWLGWLLAVGWSGFSSERARAKRIRWGVLGVCAVGIGFQMGGGISPTICLIQPHQGAYAAVARDSTEDADRPIGVLAVPLWPGESADTSLPIYYAQHYDLRLLNGYSPVVSAEYFTNVFRRLESVNQGWLDDAQADFLLAHHVRYILLHENQFPEKVSPFPVTLTRDRFMAHPRLKFIAQDGPVWAFHLLEQPRSDATKTRPVPVRFPTRRWNFDRMTDAGQRVSDSGTHGGAYLVMTEGSGQARAGPWRVAPDEALQWFLRVRGKGTIHITTQWGDAWRDSVTVDVNAADWRWMAVPLPSLPGFGQICFHMTVADGRIEADTGLLLAGEWPVDWEVGVPHSMPAVDFFHAGYSEWDTGHVQFRPAYDPDFTVFYGPKLPLTEGRYRAEWNIQTDAKPGTDLGELCMHDYVTGERRIYPVQAGQPVHMEWAQSGSHLVNWLYTYRRKAPVRIEKVVVTRLSDYEVDEAAP